MFVLGFLSICEIGDKSEKRMVIKIMNFSDQTNFCLKANNCQKFRIFVSL